MDAKTLDKIRDVCGKAIDSQYADRVAVKNVLARKAGPHLHSVVQLEVEKQLSLEEVLSVKEEVEHHLHDIHNMQTVVVDICPKGHLCLCLLCILCVSLWLFSMHHSLLAIHQSSRYHNCSLLALHHNQSPRHSKQTHQQ